MNKVNLKPFCFLSALTLCVGHLSAQKGIWYGVSCGAQNTYLYSWIRSEIDAKNAIRPFTTLDLQFQLSPKAAIQTGIGYSLYTQNTSKFKNNFNYLTIPVYLKGGSFKKDRKFALSYFAGLNFNYLLSAQNLYRGGKNDIMKYTRGFHQDYVYGLGMKYKIKDNILLETCLTGTVGGSINNVSFDGFALMNMNYGAVISLKYQLIKR